MSDVFDEKVVIGFPNQSFARLTESCFGAALDFTSGRSAILGRSTSSREMRWSKSPFAARIVVTSLTIPTPLANQRSIIIGLGDICSHECGTHEICRPEPLY